MSVPIKQPQSGARSLLQEADEQCRLLEERFEAMMTKHTDYRTDIVVDWGFADLKFNLQIPPIVDEFQANFVFNTATYDPLPDAKLTIEEVLCLPEYGGKLMRNMGLSIQGTALSKKTLYTAIERRELKHGRKNLKNIYLTRAWVAEWMVLRNVESEGAFVPEEKKSSSVEDIKKRQRGTRSNAAAARKATAEGATSNARERIKAAREKLKGN